MRKVYISGALMGAQDLEEARQLYAHFAAACQQVGWEAYLPHQNTDPIDTAQLDNVEVALKDLEAIQQSDVIVMYLGQPSLGVGAEAILAMHYGLYVLAIHEAERSFSRFVRGLLESYHLASIFSYNSVGEACDWIQHQLTILPEAKAIRPVTLAETLDMVFNTRALHK